MNTKYEKSKLLEGFSHVIGCDEVGRACLAGPVVAAAVILPSVESNKLKVIKYREINDSKQLSPQKREELAPLIQQHSIAWGIGVVSEKTIDEINIHHASLLAMRKAVESLLASLVASEAGPRLPPRLAIGETGRGDGEMFLTIDGKFKVPNISLNQEAVVAGDAKVLSIAAASIIAKVYRDNLMKKLHETYPIYNFAQHKGYPTKFHREMISKNGLTIIHRLSFCGQFV